MRVNFFLRLYAFFFGRGPAAAVGLAEFLPPVLPPPALLPFVLPSVLRDWPGEGSVAARRAHAAVPRLVDRPPSSNLPPAVMDDSVPMFGLFLVNPLDLGC